MFDLFQINYFPIYLIVFSLVLTVRQHLFDVNHSDGPHLKSSIISLFNENDDDNNNENNNEKIKNQAL